MCGIAGIFAFDRFQPVAEELAVAMRDSLAHRGPDGTGMHLAPGCALGHRRLAIIDLAGGDQPIYNEDRSLAVVFNGEIYNFQALAAELRSLGHRFATRSDTEVLVHGFEQWGERVVERLEGMFAFAIHDRANHRLFLARDRLGKKPLYYRLEAGRLLFGSELKAILADRSVPRRVRLESLGEYLALRYVPQPHTLIEGVLKLPPAHWMMVDEGGRVRSERYWDLSFADPLDQGRRAWADTIAGELDRAVRARLISEVPLGAFLSGGIDSSAVVSSMTLAGAGPVKACSVGFADAEFDERPFAREAAQLFGADLEEAEVRPDPERDLETLVHHLDDPLADSSALPTWHVSRITRRRVTVALSGDGGDENFAGYRRYPFDVLENRVRGFLPRPLRRPVFSLAGALYPKADSLPRNLRWKRTLENLGRDPAEAYFRSVSCAVPEDVEALLTPEVALQGFDPFAALRRAYERADGPDSLSRVLYTDFHTWLPDDILAKVDRASMAVGLEVRCPLLDHRFVEMCARIPSSEKIRGGEGKAVFKDAIAERIPRGALTRPKQGFAIPAARWTRRELSGVLDRVQDGELARSYLRRERVSSLIAAHRAGRRDWSEILWSLLFLDRWHRRWIEGG